MFGDEDRAVAAQGREKKGCTRKERKEGVQEEEVWRMIVHGARIWISRSLLHDEVACLMMSIAIGRCKLSTLQSN
jgi:hypothetical protein